jgi:bacterioferritin (cytochrome b1)
MKGNADVIKVLNDVLRKELTRIISTLYIPRCAKTGVTKCSPTFTGTSPSTK